MTLTDSLVSGNTVSSARSSAQGGGLSVDTAILEKVTLFGNVLDGGAASRASAVETSIGGNFTNVTITGNEGAPAVFGAATLTASILAGNPGGDDPGELAFDGVNLVGIGPDPDPADDLILAPTLDALFVVDRGRPLLADNGGPVKTVALRAAVDNPALDAAGAGAATTDARGEPELDLPGIDNGGVRDLGAPAEP